MRFLVAGLVLIAVGVGLTEYMRRTQEPSAAGASAAGKKKSKAKSGPLPTVKALIETSTPEADAPMSLGPFATAVGALASTASADGFTTVLSGAFTARELTGSDTFAVAVVGAGSTSGLVKVPVGGPPQALVARKNPISSVAIDGDTVWWGEGNRVMVAGPDGMASVKAQFVTASVMGVAAKNGTVVAALVPKDADPFSTDPTGVVVKIEADGSALLVASDQVRPHDLRLHGSDVFFVAGYPSALVRAALDGSFSSQIAERADGPVAFDGEGLVYRAPLTGAPEVHRIAPAGGNEVVLARGDIDWLAASNGVTRYTTVGIGARLYEVSPGQEPKEVVAVKGVAKGVAMVGEHIVLCSTNDDGSSVLRVK